MMGSGSYIDLESMNVHVEAQALYFGIRNSSSRKKITQNLGHSKNYMDK